VRTSIRDAVVNLAYLSLISSLARAFKRAGWKVVGVEETGLVDKLSSSNAQSKLMHSNIVSLSGQLG
jgi:hypothetical protein